MPRRTQRLDGHSPPSWRRKRFKIRKGRHPRAHRPTPPQSQEKRPARVEARDVLCRTLPSRIHAVCDRSVPVHSECYVGSECYAASRSSGSSGWSEVAPAFEWLYKKTGGTTSGTTSTNRAERRGAADSSASDSASASADARTREDAASWERVEEASGGAGGRWGGPSEACVRAAVAASQPRLRARPRPVDVAPVVTTATVTQDCVTRVWYKLFCCLFIDVPRTDVCYWLIKLCMVSCSARLSLLKFVFGFNKIRFLFLRSNFVIWYPNFNVFRVGD